MIRNHLFAFTFTLMRVINSNVEKNERTKNMKIIEKLEQAREQNADLKEWGINNKFYRAYQKTLKTNNETIDFDDVLWDHDVEEIIKHCKEFEIKYITISSNYSGLIQTLGLFVDKGCKIRELKKIKSQYTDLNSEEHEIVNAIEIEIY